MEHTKIVKIKDGEIEKQFIITKLKCVNTLLLTHKLAGMLAKTNEITPETLKQIIYSKMGTGIVIESKDHEDTKRIKAEADALANLQLFEVLFNVIKSMLAGTDDEKQLEVLKLLISCVTYQNGALQIPLNMLEGSDCNVDSHIEDVSTLYQIIWEVLKLHYGHFFLKKKE